MLKQSFVFNDRPAIVRIVLAALLAICIFPGVVRADNTVKLMVGGKEAPFEVPPYVSDSGAVMAPVDFVRLLGADYKANADGSLIITSATGNSFPATYKCIQDRLMVPLESTADALGAATDWSPSTSTFTLKAKLEMAQVVDDKVVIATSYPVYYKTQTVDNPPRLVIDIFGADLDSPPATIPSDSALVTRIRSGQLDPQTVRLVLDLTQPIHFQVASSLQTNDIQLALGTSQTDTTPVPVISAAPVAPTSGPLLSDNGKRIVPVGLIPLPPLPNLSTTGGSSEMQPTKIVDVEYKTSAPNIYQVVVTTAGPTDQASSAYKSFMLDNPGRLAFDISNSVLSLATTAENAVASIIPNDNPLFKSIRWGMVTGAAEANGRIVVDLLRPVVYTVDTTNLPDNSGVQYTITIEESSAAVASDSIVGKVIIVDPGHGGKDTGAPGAGGIYEKNFTLSIAKQVRDALIAAGARPIMTRSDDTFIPLDDRSQLGIDNHADYFISIHCDSSGAQNSHSGDTVYYHGDVAPCRELARSIANRLAQLDISIQSDGVKSDYVRFPGVGFSVLRKSPEPAVLVECGYVNDDGDAKCLEDTASQQQLATGIVAGLRDFIANQ